MQIGSTLPESTDNLGLLCLRRDGKDYTSSPHHPQFMQSHSARDRRPNGGRRKICADLNVHVLHWRCAVEIGGASSAVLGPSSRLAYGRQRITAAIWHEGPNPRTWTAARVRVTTTTASVWTLDGVTGLCQTLCLFGLALTRTRTWIVGIYGWWTKRCPPAFEHPRLHFPPSSVSAPRRLPSVLDLSTHPAPYVTAVPPHLRVVRFVHLRPSYSGVTWCELGRMVPLKFCSSVSRLSCLLLITELMQSEVMSD